MTREEAISKVKGYLTDCLPSDDYEEVEEIVKALEQESTTKNDLGVDCISSKIAKGKVCPLTCIKLRNAAVSLSSLRSSTWKHSILFSAKKSLVT